MTENAGFDEEIKKYTEKVLANLNPSAPDRDYVIVTAAYVTDLMESRLQSLFVENKEISDRIFDPLKNGALSNFTPMVDLAYLLGLITEPVLRWLKLMARVRNLFAHEWLISNFADVESANDKGIQDTLKKLRDFIPPMASTNAHPLREAYAMLLISIFIGLEPLMTHKPKHTPAKKWQFEVPEGVKEWHALFKNFADENPETYALVLAELQKANDSKSTGQG